MSKQKTVVRSGGIGLGGALFLLFTALKLTGFLEWSWWWVTAPLWVPLAFALAVLIVVAGGAAVVWITATVVMVIRHHRAKKLGRRVVSNKFTLE